MTALLLHNPVFGNELRKSLVRRKPILCFGVWAAGIALLILIASRLPQMNSELFVRFPYLLLPILAPAFAAGAFAKEKEQRTWEDLRLTSLTPGQLLVGKFLAAYLPVMLVLITLLPPVAIGFVLNRNAEVTLGNYAGIGYGFQRVDTDYMSPILMLVLKSALQAPFYVTVALVCSHYCSKSRVALTVCYISLAVYAFAAISMFGALDSGFASQGAWGMIANRSWTLGFVETLHLLTCGIVTIGFWVLLSVGIRFEQERSAN